MQDMYEFWAKKGAEHRVTCVSSVGSPGLPCALCTPLSASEAGRYEPHQRSSLLSGSQLGSDDGAGVGIGPCRCWFLWAW